MDTTVLNDKHYTIEEYYAIEAQAHDMRVEYLNGTLRSMARGTIEHAIISRNILVSLVNLLKGSECNAFNSDTHLAIDELQTVLHPDTFIVCGSIEKSKFDLHGIANASVIIEVLSNSTQNYDRGDKFRMYRQLASFKEYILIDQTKVSIETYLHHEGNLWEINSYRGLENNLQIKTLNIEIPISEIYEDITFNTM